MNAGKPGSIEHLRQYLLVSDLVTLLGVPVAVLLGYPHVGVLIATVRGIEFLKHAFPSLRFEVGPQETRFWGWVATGVVQGLVLCAVCADGTGEFDKTALRDCMAFIVFDFVWTTAVTSFFAYKNPRSTV
jgi:hypothetical protein